MDDSVITCDEIRESYEEQTNFNGKSKLEKAKFLYFTCIVINYYSIFDSC